MRQFHIPGKTHDSTQGFSKHEKRRLMILIAGSLLVGSAILVGVYKSRAGSSEGRITLDQAEFEESVAAPEIDAAAIDALVEDDTPAKRVVLEGEGLDYVSGLVRNMTPGQYLALGLHDLTPEVFASLWKTPSQHRGEALTLRGWVDSSRSRHRNGTTEHIARLRLEQGGIEGEQYAYFVAGQIPEPLLEGDFVRLDGLFLKLFSDESRVDSGSWLEGPLLVGREARRSVAAFGPVTKLDPREFADVSDDDLLASDGRPVDPRNAIPFSAMWNLMAYARDMPAAAVDWSQATELDDLALRDLSEDGQSHRLQPYRIPVSRIQGARVKVAPENPARISQFTEGWLGSTTWSNVVRFSGPFQDREAEIADLVEARGFFLKNFAYLSADRGIRVAPFFVLQSMEIVHPEPAPIYDTIVRSMVIGGLIFLGGFVILILRSSSRSKSLQQDLLQRKQARRKKRALQGQNS